MLYSAKYYQIFTGIPQSGNADNELVDYLVTGYTNVELQEIRPTVFISMAGTFLLGLFAGYKIYSKEKYRKIKMNGTNLDSGMSQDAKSNENNDIYERAVKAVNQCPACGHDNPADDKICGDCGLNLH
jgi:hypothetical protein